MTRRNPSRSLTELAAEFDRLRRRAGRQRRSIEESTQAWKRWSSTVDEAMAVAATISMAPATSQGDLRIKFAALLRIIVFNSSIVDNDDLKSLRRFGRDLAALK